MQRKCGRAHIGDTVGAQDVEGERAQPSDDAGLAPDAAGVLAERAVADVVVAVIDLSRRLFAVTSLAAGFASAVKPVSAATITTDVEGLDAIWGISA